MYWLLTSDEPDDQSLALMGREPELDDLLDDFLWTDGKKIEVQLPTPLKFYLDPDEGDFIPAYFEPVIPLMTKEMVSILIDSGVSSIQTFQACVYDKSELQIEGEYFVVNITNRIVCVDLEKSVYKPRKGSKRLFFRKIVIDESKTNGALLFRLHEAPSEVIIHDKVKQKLESACFPGLEFVRVS